MCTPFSAYFHFYRIEITGSMASVTDHTAIIQTLWCMATPPIIPQKMALFLAAHSQVVVSLWRLLSGLGPSMVATTRHNGVVGSRLVCTKSHILLWLSLWQRCTNWCTIHHRFSLLWLISHRRRTLHSELWCRNPASMLSPGLFCWPIDGEKLWTRSTQVWRGITWCDCIKTGSLQPTRLCTA